MEAGMRISINGVELVLPDDQPVRIDGGVVSVGAATRTAPLQIEHKPQGASAATFVEKRGGNRPGAGRPRKVLETTQQVKDAIVRLLRQHNRPVTTRMFSLKLTFAKEQSPWQRKRYLDLVLNEMRAAGVVMYSTDGRNHWWGLPGMAAYPVEHPQGVQLPIADDDVAA
jgi:hypothetical protein